MIRQMVIDEMMKKYSNRVRGESELNSRIGRIRVESILVI